MALLEKETLGGKKCLKVPVNGSKRASREDVCVRCGGQIPSKGHSRKLYCSARCRIIAWALRIVKEEKRSLKIPVSVFLISMLLSGPVFSATGIVSHYSKECCRYNKDPKCPTASGESLYKLIEDKTPYVAMWGIRFGTKVKFTNPKNGKETVGIVLDRGPAKRLKRIADVSPIIFERLGITKFQGLAELKVDSIPLKD